MNPRAQNPLRSKAVLFAFGCLWLAGTLAANTFFERVQIENAINDQIIRALSASISREKFLVFSSVQVRTNREREINSVESETFRKTPTVPSIEIEEELPGFPELTIPKDKSLYTEEKTSTKEKYNYTETLDVTQVDIKVILDTSLSAPKVAQIQQSLTSTIQSSYGDRGNIVFQTANLKERQRTMNDFIRENAVPLVLVGTSILALFILFVFILLAMRLLFGKGDNKQARSYGRRRRRKSPPQKAVAGSPLPLDAAPKPSLSKQEGPSPEEDARLAALKESENYERENVIIRDFIKKPLTFRKYLSDLSLEEKTQLAACFESPRITKIFGQLEPQILKQDDPFKGFDRADTLAKRQELLRKHIRNYTQYDRIIEAQNVDEFSQLSLLTKGECRNIFKQLSLEDQAVLLKHVDKEIYRYYIKSLKEEHKQEIFSYLTQKKEQQTSPETIGALQKKIGQELNNVSRKIFIDLTNEEDLFGILIEEAQDSKLLLERMRDYNKDLYEQYKPYAIGLEELALENDETMKAVLAGVENETIALSLTQLPEAIQSKVTQNLSEERQEYVTGILSTRKGRIGAEEAQEATKQFLNTYRRHKVDQPQAPSI